MVKDLVSVSVTHLDSLRAGIFNDMFICRSVRFHAFVLVQNVFRVRVNPKPVVLSESMLARPVPHWFKWFKDHSLMPTSPIELIKVNSHSGNGFVLGEHTLKAVACLTPMIRL